MKYPLQNQKGEILTATVLIVGAISALITSATVIKGARDTEEMIKLYTTIRNQAQISRERAVTAEPLTREVYERNAAQLERFAEVIRGGQLLIHWNLIKDTAKDQAMSALLGAGAKPGKVTAGQIIDAYRTVFNMETEYYNNVAYQGGETEKFPEHEAFLRRLAENAPVPIHVLFRDALEARVRGLYEASGGGYDKANKPKNSNLMNTARMYVRYNIDFSGLLPSRTTDSPDFRQAYRDVFGIEFTLPTKPAPARAPETTTTVPQRTAANCEKEEDVCFDKKELLMKQYFKRQKEIVSSGQDIGEEPYESELNQLWEGVLAAERSCVDQMVICCKEAGFKNPVRGIGVCREAK